MTGVICALLLFALLPGAPTISLSDMYGSLQSPNFPEPYPKESQLTWNISVPSGYQIRLYFMHFDLEPSYLCEYDYVKLEAELEVLATFCGREDTDTEHVPGEQVIMSPGNTLSLTFRSDFSNEERYSGFEAHYSAVDVDECQDKNDEDLACDHYCHNYIGGYYCSCRYGYLLHSDNRTCKVECADSTFTEKTGMLSSSDFPNPYPKSSDCVYRIELEDGFLISLEFDDTFDIEDHPEVTCPYDYIKIVAGQKEFGPFCGDRSPGSIQTGSNSVQILFHSDNSGDNIGWRLFYRASGNQCPALQPPANGQIEPVLPHYSFKDHILVTCQHGYRVFMNDAEMEHYQIVCGKDGTWSSSMPTCTMVDCKAPVEIDKGVVVFETPSNSTLFGSKIHYSCREPLYQMHPKINSTYTCGVRGEWTNEETGTKLPSCLPVCGQPEQAFPALLKRIVGGRSASPGLFPWQALLLVEDVSRVPEDRWFGSGALLSDSWVLTAAHVLRSHRRDPSVIPVSPEHVKVHLGLNHIQSKHLAINRSVESLVLHPQFDPRNYNNDIALVKLSEKVPMSPLVLPVCLPSPDPNRSSLQPNTLGLVAGWGISNPNVSMDNALSLDLDVVTDVLQYVKLPVVAQEECQSSYTSRSGKYNITDNMFCAGFFEGGRDTCLGDSGGAFVMADPRTGRWVAQGLVSWGGPEECGSQRVYGVYTKVSNYAEWLQSHLNLDQWW
ncbi:mannan-binding lectin serine protease 1 isoform X1 [Scleropages formosus]|uniref:MBL associated serine protease 1 n=1 Tax=Scleropages formosus TaxID=113540 RepID=A0A8C9V4L2_SCLFO|nr:mannan-binding lectin serine protease 1 isoform X1 [Scleropages formosus]